MSSSLPANMTPRDAITNRILEIVAEKPGCQVTHVAQLLPDATLREVVHALSYLNQSGQLLLVVGDQGVLFVTVSPRLFH